METEMDTQESENLVEEEATLEPEEVEVNEELEKAKSAFNDQKIRAEKAEKELKRLRALESTKVVEKPTTGLSIKDAVAIRDLHEDDAQYLVDESNLRNIPVYDLKKDKYIQIILKTRAEERKTAEATNTGAGNRGKTNSTEALLHKVDRQEEMEDADYKEAAKALVANMRDKK